jgi:hypothetical protein
MKCRPSITTVHANCLYDERFMMTFELSFMQSGSYIRQLEQNEIFRTTFSVHSNTIFNRNSFSSFGKPDAAAEWLTVLRRIWELRVQISARRLDILTEVFRVFPQSRKCWDSPLK